MSTVPNDVRVNRKTMDEAAAIAGRRSGRVTRLNVCHADVPSERAASSRRGSRWLQTPPTILTTTATLKNTWAARMAHTVPCRSMPSTPDGPASARNAAPTTTVGSTNGTVAIARASVRPGKSNLASTQVAGIANSTVRTVEATACHKVNQTTPRRPPSVRTRPTAPLSSVSPVAMIDATGHTKKASRKRAGAAARVIAARRVTSAPHPTTRRASALGS
jgi:hypothetical protein